MADFKDGDDVTWEWGKGTAHGKVVKVHHERVEKTIKGHKVTRNASKEEPAYLVRQEDGDEVLKSGSELKRA